MRPHRRPQRIRRCVARADAPQPGRRYQRQEPRRGLNAAPPRRRRRTRQAGQVPDRERSFAQSGEWGELRARSGCVDILPE